MQFGNKNWHRLSVQQAEAGERWSVIWDTKRRAATDSRNTAVEKSQGAALDRARHLLRMEFIVYEIRDPDGTVVLEEAAITAVWDRAQDDSRAAAFAAARHA